MDFKVGDKVLIKLSPLCNELEWGGASYLVGCYGIIRSVSDTMIYCDPADGGWKNGSKDRCVFAPDELKPIYLSPREQARAFVKTHLKRPTKADYKRFEEAFLKGGDFGM